MAPAHTIAKTVTRILQALFAIICLACAAVWADLFKGILSFGPISFAIFAGVSGLVVSILLGVVPCCKKLAKLAGLPDCIISAVWAVFFLAVGASLASWGTCAAGGGMTGAGSMSRNMALMFGDSSVESSFSSTGGNTATTNGITNANLANTAAYFNNLVSQMSANIPHRHLLSKDGSDTMGMGLGRKGAPAAADVTSVSRRQLLGSMMSAMMQPQVLCGTWDAVVACGFINFVLYAASAVFAFLECRASKQAAPATQQVQDAKPAAAAQPAAEPAAALAAQPAVEPAAQPAVELAAQSAAEPAAVPAAVHAVQSAVEPAAQSAAQPEAAPTAEPAAQPAAQPAA